MVADAGATDRKSLPLMDPSWVQDRLMCHLAVCLMAESEVALVYRLVGRNSGVALLFIERRGVTGPERTVTTLTDLG
jgi:hypothetical protein